jgi:hypothetical protein
LQDGAPLAESVDENFAPTVSYGENVQLNETETIISSRGETPAVQPRAVEPIRMICPPHPNILRSNIRCRPPWIGRQPPRRADRKLCRSYC